MGKSHRALQRLLRLKRHWLHSLNARRPINQRNPKRKFLVLSLRRSKKLSSNLWTRVAPATLVLGVSILPHTTTTILMRIDFDESNFVTCTQCDDYDLCIACHVQNRHGHHPSHAFMPASKETTLNMLASKLLAPGRNVRHAAICDGCDKVSLLSCWYACWLTNYRTSLVFAISA